MTVHLGLYLALMERAEEALADAFRVVGRGHADEPDVLGICQTLAGQCEAHAARLGPFVERYGEEAPDPPERLHTEIFGGKARGGGLGLLRDLHDLYLMACECDITWTMLAQGAQGARDTDLLDAVQGCEHETANQIAWLRTRMKSAAPQALVVA